MVNPVKNTRRKYENALLNVPGVVGVATNPDKKLLLLLESKKYLNSTPDYIDSVPVRKIVVGKMRILPASKQIPNREKVRPLTGGVSISPPELIAGTLGIITENDVMLTNAHVAAVNYRLKKMYPEHKTQIYQPGWLDGGTDKDLVGELDIYTNLKNDVPHTVDGATCDILKGIQYKKMEVLGIGEVEGWEVPERGQVVYKSGRTTGVTKSYIVTNDATVRMGGYPWGEVIFKDCIITIPAIASEGDSGSVLVSEERHVAGLVFGGSDVATAACRMDNVIPELGICLGRRYKSSEPNVLMESINDTLKGVAVALIPAALLKLAPAIP